MRFEDIYKKFKEAADQHHPAYDEKAWQKMEKLLNLHLPKPKNDRRRMLLFLAAFLLIGGGGYLLVSAPWQNESKIAVQPSQEHSNSKRANLEKANKETSAPQQSETKNEIETTTGQLHISGTRVEDNNNPVQNTKGLISTKLKNTVANQHQILEGQIQKGNNEPAESNTISNHRKPQIENGKAIAQDQSKDISSKSPSQTEVTNEKVVKDEVKQASESNPTGVAKTDTKYTSFKKNEKNAAGNGFSFSVSAGPDISKAGNSKPGETTFAYGAGVGYTLNRFTLRTGVYASKKIYWAGPEDYSLAYVPSTTSKFEGADADCYVIEVPLKLSYNFAVGNKSNWFAGAGLSSYFMKRETYNYIYKTSWGTYTHTLEVKNENKHYFSVLNLSGGYTHRIGNIFSISAEPYLEYPLTGIGEGKVNLKSAGVLFTLGVKPFKK